MELYYQVYDVEDGMGELRQVFYCDSVEREPLPFPLSRENVTLLGTITVSGKEEVVNYIPDLLAELTREELCDILCVKEEPNA